jgi:hypothetical protein
MTLPHGHKSTLNLAAKRQRSHVAHAAVVVLCLIQIGMLLFKGAEGVVFSQKIYTSSKQPALGLGDKRSK